MNVVIIVNIIVSLAIILGGFCMRNHAKNPVDYSIGFKTKRAMSSKEAWYFANQKCGVIWSIIGITGFVLTIAAILLVQNEKLEGFVQLSVPILQIVAIVFSYVLIEKQLKNKYGDNNSKF